MDEAIEVLGVEVEWTGVGWEARTPLGAVAANLNAGESGWAVSWWPKGQRLMRVEIVPSARTPADAAREATRRLRAIQRTCARAGAV